MLLPHPAPQVTAMRTTVTNILGTLPPQFFRVTISTAGENLAQLMYSVIMTGYMFRNAWYRMELRSSLGGGAVPGVGESMGCRKRAHRVFIRRPEDESCWCGSVVQLPNRVGVRMKQAAA